MGGSKNGFFIFYERVLALNFEVISGLGQPTCENRCNLLYIVFIVFSNMLHLELLMGLHMWIMIYSKILVLLCCTKTILHQYPFFTAGYGSMRNLWKDNRRFNWTTPQEVCKTLHFHCISYANMYCNLVFTLKVLSSHLN